jgi:hypothetical protein
MHEIHALWLSATSEGLAVSANLPPWAELLSQLHARPYHLRYSTGVNGLVTPASEPMVAELEALVEQVAKQL